MMDCPDGPLRVAPEQNIALAVTPVGVMAGFLLAALRVVFYALAARVAAAVMTVPVAVVVVGAVACLTMVVQETPVVMQTRLHIIAYQ